MLTERDGVAVAALGLWIGRIVVLFIMLALVLGLVDGLVPFIDLGFADFWSEPEPPPHEVAPLP